MKHFLVQGFPKDVVPTFCDPFAADVLQPIGAQLDNLNVTILMVTDNTLYFCTQ